MMLVIHNLLRWLILLFGLWTVLNAVGGLLSKKEFTANDNRSNFFFMLSMDIQLLVGLGLFFSGQWFDRMKHLSENMKDANLRFFTMEHEVLMIIAWILVHVGRVSVKKAITSRAKFKRSLVFFGITLVLILIAIPWPFREAVARPLFRWF
ncbi:MAG: cytochrome B [Bacteroidota bacterium]|nr:cytochrome B [Bacteroidota bacterium]